MLDMSDKLTFINRDDNGCIKSVGNLVGCSFDEASTEAQELEKTPGNHYTLIRDKELFEIVQYFVDKDIDNSLEKTLDK